MFYLTYTFIALCPMVSTFINNNYKKIILTAIIVCVPDNEAQRG